MLLLKKKGKNINFIKKKIFNFDWKLRKKSFFLNVYRIHNNECFSIK